MPLAEAGPGAPYVNARATSRRGLRRSWPPALIVVTLLAVFAAGVAVASRVFSRPQTPAAVAPAQAAEVPAQAGPPPAEAEAPREVADTKPGTRATRDTRVRRAEAAGQPVRVEAARDDAEDSESEDEDRRVRGRGKRRARVEDDGEKEIRRAF